MQQSRCRWTAIHFILVLLMGTLWGLSLEAQVVPQPKAGDPLNTLNASQLERFLLGKTQFLRSFSEAEGLGPGFNQDSCASCHAVPIGGTSPITVTRFGTADKGAPFDPMDAEGGSLLQANAISTECLEVVPATATIIADRITPSILGAGLVEAIDNADIEALQASGGTVHWVPVLEDPTAPLTVGRFGWKAQLATLMSFSGDATLMEMGITNSILPLENAPNGDTTLLPICDSVADPEEPLDNGVPYLDRITDFQKFLAPAPQTPRSGMTGETIFNDIGCADCHHPQFTTGVSAEPGLTGISLKPYSDFLLHDMGALGDGIAQGDALEVEMKTPPLWGLRIRGQLLHDGRVLVQTLYQGVNDSVNWHFGEAFASSQAWNNLTKGEQDKVVAFLDSLGRAEYDTDGNNFIDESDLNGFSACWTGDAPGSFDADSPCAIHDLDQDGDVDSIDLEGLEQVFLGTVEDCDLNGTWDLIEILTQGGDIDGNGVLDACESPLFRRADSNLDSTVDISDAVSLLGALFSGNAPPSCFDASDCNDDGALDIGDAIFLLSFLFSSGTEIPAPGAQSCGQDPTPDGLDCLSPNSCP
ncbi:MAG: di-heme oxidoredictase family protein [Planctomycetota bacterium]|nr:di-heme oxidoredictase family protein [Planctomycetota bacterium]